MWKHVIASSVQSAYVGSMLIVLFSLPTYGGAATIFGVITFPVIIFWCLILAFPLIKLREKCQLTEYAFFIIYLIAGLVFGVLTPVLMFGMGAQFDNQSATLLGLYGLLGAACAITAWSYVRKNISL